MSCDLSFPGEFRGVVLDKETLIQYSAGLQIGELVESVSARSVEREQKVNEWMNE